MSVGKRTKSAGDQIIFSLTVQAAVCSNIHLYRCRVCMWRMLTQFIAGSNLSLSTHWLSDLFMRAHQGVHGKASEASITGLLVSTQRPSISTSCGGHSPSINMVTSLHFCWENPLFDFNSRWQQRMTSERNFKMTGNYSVSYCSYKMI